MSEQNLSIETSVLVPGGMTGRKTTEGYSWNTIESILTSGETRAVHNFDGDKVEIWRLTSIACGGECKRFEDMEPSGIKLKHFYCHLVDIQAKTGGEMNSCIRTVLLDTNDNAYGFVSDFIHRELDTIISIFGKGPWKDGIGLKVNKTKTRTGYNVYTITPTKS